MNKINSFAPLLLSICLLIANISVLASIMQDRQSFKSEITYIVEENRKQLKEYFGERFESIELPLNKKLEMFTPRIVSEDRYNNLKADIKETNLRLARIEVALNINTEK
jgi:hypothetical protein